MRQASTSVAAFPWGRAVLFVATSPLFMVALAVMAEASDQAILLAYGATALVAIVWVAVERPQPSANAYGSPDRSVRPSWMRSHRPVLAVVVGVLALVSRAPDDWWGLLDEAPAVHDEEFDPAASLHDIFGGIVLASGEMDGATWTFALEPATGAIGEQLCLRLVGDVDATARHAASLAMARYCGATGGRSRLPAGVEQGDDTALPPAPTITPSTPRFLFGPMVGHVVRVVVEFDDHQPVQAPIVGDDLGRDVSYYVLVLPPGVQPTAVVGYDDDGNEVVRVGAYGEDMCEDHASAPPSQPPRDGEPHTTEPQYGCGVVGGGSGR